MSTVSASWIADHIIRIAHEHGAFISNLKLQKLLYYAQGWHLAVFNTPLFDDRIEAWVHGPVVPSVYHRFKTYRFGNIDEAAMPPALHEQTQRFLLELLKTYLGLDAYALELLTHQETPWLNARGDLPPASPSKRQISVEDMNAYFGARLHDASGST